MITGVNAAAWNQRKVFQNQDFPRSLPRPPALIALVLTKTIRDPDRAIITMMCPKAAKISTTPSTPITVATDPSVTSWASSVVPSGSNCDHESMWSSWLRIAAVIPCTAAMTTRA